MLEKSKIKIYKWLKWGEKYIQTDLVYLAKNGSWLFLNQFSASLIALLLSIAFANFAMKETYGTYKYLQSFIGLLSVFTLSGMNTALIPAISNGCENIIEKAKKIKFKWALIATMVSFSISIYYLIHQNYNFAIIFFITAIIFPFTDSAQIYDSYLTGKMDFKTSSKYSILQNIIINSTLILFLLKYPDNYVLLILTYTIGQFIVTNYYYKKIKDRINNNCGVKPDDGNYERYAKHLSLMNILSMVADKIDTLSVFQLLEPSQLAIYSFSVAIPEQIKGLFKNITTLSLPKFSQRNILDIKDKIYKKTFQLAIILSVFIILYILSAPLIFKMLFPKYMESVIYSQIFSISLLFISLSPFSMVIIAKQKIKYLYILNTVSSLTLIITTITFTYFWGIMGTIFAQIVYRSVPNILTIILFSKL